MSPARQLTRLNETNQILQKLAQRYNLNALSEILKNGSSKIFEKDVYVCLHDIVDAVLSSEAGNDSQILENLKKAKNIYNTPIFLINQTKGTYLIRNKPDFDRALQEVGKYQNALNLSPYSAINTFLAVVESQIVGFALDDLLQKGIEHVENFIAHQLKINPNWDKSTLISKNPVLIIPIGAAGTGKSTFYKELSNVVNISCDNVRYLLFKEFGPCFSPWESALAWWVVNQLTDIYLRKGISVFYNGVNTDMEYRSPMTMENRDPLYAGIPYKIKLVYFEPPVKLSDGELKELKSINLWVTPLDKVDFSKLSGNVAKIMDLIKNNYQRTLSRTKEISEGKRQQDPYDVLYSVPPAIVKLFVEQSFDAPSGNNVIIIPRKEIPDEKERSAFYREYAMKVMTT